MKTTLLFLIFATFANAQNSKSDKIRISEIEKIIKKSYYSTIYPDMNYKYYSKTYFCLEKKYKLDIYSEKEFLNKKEFLKFYPNWSNDNDTDIENKSTIQLATSADQYDLNGTNYVYPKCLKHWNSK